ncbi:MAG: threonine/serine dehydratase [Pseudomonadota bacterium]
MDGSNLDGHSTGHGLAVGLADLLAARDRIAAEALRTPLLRSPLLDSLTGGVVYLKAENLQRTGSFKFRGAFNRLSLIPPDRRRFGVVACSSGNHAQGVAEAARLLGMPATIVMPSDAPETKRVRTERSGARVVGYDREQEDRYQIADALCREQGATFVHPFDDPAVIAGQGTCGLEICDQLASEARTPDTVLICCGGGGLTAGVTLAIKHQFPDCACYAVEPAGFDDTARSLRSGQRETNSASSGSVCDAILVEQPGETTFAINRTMLAGGLVVSDADALQAVAFAFREAKLVLEPGGAVALAALLSKTVDVTGKVAVAVLSGGNIDHAMMDRALSA